MNGIGQSPELARIIVWDGRNGECQGCGRMFSDEDEANVHRCKNRRPPEEALLKTYGGRA